MRIFKFEFRWEWPAKYMDLEVPRPEAPTGPLSTSPRAQDHHHHNSTNKLSRWLEINTPVTGSEPVKKRRGKPRKYGLETDKAPMGFVPGPPSFTVIQYSGDGGGSGREGTSPTVKKMRGRPSGSNREKISGRLDIPFI
ncbi:hypothetical protein Bca4012_011865 [Brassica carinata]